MAPGKTTPLTSMSVFCAMSSSNRGGPLSLPLLEGLLTRPGAADACVKDALHRWRAGHRISSFIYRHFQSSTGGINKRRTRRMSTFQSSHHWLIQGLQSPSQMERRVAFQILGQGCLLDKHSVWEVLEIISHLLRAKETKSRAILLTLMDHIVMQILSKAERLAFLKNSRLGLNFLCQWLWKITSDPKGANIENIPSLVGFLHRVILDSNETHALLWQKIGKQPSFPQLSPLACLIGCYQICKTSPILKASVMDSSIILLKQLIDPFPSLPTNKVASKDNEKPLRLIETFANTKSEDATVQTSTGTSSSTTIGRHRSSSSSSLSQSSRRRPISVSMQEERSAAAAAVARIFSAVYGNDEDHDVDIVVGAAEQSDEEMLENSEQIPEEKQEQAEDVDSEQEGKINDNSDEEARDDGDIASEDDNEEDQEEDEEINSDEGEEEEDEEEEDSDERDDHDNELVIHEEEVDVSDLLEFGDMNVDEPLNEHPQTSINPNTSPSVSQKTVANPQIVKERRQYYIQASMEILQMQYPPLRHSIRNESPKNGLSVKAEHALMTSIVNIVKPPKKPVNTKIILRRAPTQEEFFRGSLSKNPVSLNMLKSHQNQNEPTVKDLRQHIANDLQMSDSAELLELICANKILDVNLKLRVVHQVVWKEHLLQHAPASGSSSERSASVLSSFLEGGGSSGRSFISTGSGLSMIFSSGFERSLSGGSSAFNISPDTPLSALPPMIVTYRLTGVDGEATEDTVSTLQDPEAPAETTSSEELERLMEQKFGITRLATAGRGVFCLLRSIERSTNDTLRKIRRDDVILVETPYESAKKNPNNPSRSTFKATSPSPGLELLLCCSKLPSNRKLLLKSRAPTILLRLLLSVLHALEEDGSEDELASESNSVAKALQKLIETLASDMVSSTDTIQKDEEAEDVEQDASTLRLLLSAIETSSLSRPLRNIIAKLLPYLTYGQPALSKELACKFVHHVTPERLQQYGLHEGDKEDATRLILVATFIHTSISLPPNPVCNSLRFELLQSGFLERIAAFLLQDIPKEPPSWSPSLWPKSKCMSEDEKVQLEGQWRHYLNRPGLKTSFDILIGLCKQHEPTQTFLGSYKMYKDKLPLILACHWLESTSDGSRIAMKGIGLVAETLLDELAQDSSSVTEKVKEIRRNTRNRKKEIAMERRKRALVSIGSFGPSADTIQIENEKVSVRGTAASLLAPVLGLFGASEPSDSSPPSKRRKKDNVSPADKNTSVKPAWMTEMENMQDEDGLTCAVCQEGRTLQPSELLGLYAYVKKVSIPMNQCGARASIDGTDLLTSLPVSSPDSISDSHAALEWFPAAKAAGEVLHDYSRSSSTASSKRAIHTTTVSAGNGIHFSCHTKARQADRSHPKAPKSEWEGASLRNSRVKCNVIMPIVSSRSSKVPLVAVDVALTDHQTAVSNLLNARPKSMLWNVLHDVRFLLLRMAYAEQLNADCGGGSLFSNSQLLLYQLLMVDMFEKDAQVDAPETCLHARSLSAGFLAACAITDCEDYDKRKQNALNRGIADSSLMAALTCILFHNTKDDYGVSSKCSEDTPHAKRRWVTGREYFLKGLLNCAGRRHALGIESSGCITNRNAGNKRGRSNSFADWEVVEDGDTMEIDSPSGGFSQRSIGDTNSSSKAGIDDFRDALRPMLVYFAMMDQLSRDFVLHMDDCKIEDCSNRLVQVIQDCHSAKSIRELLGKANVSMDDDAIMDELQKGMLSA